MPFLNLPVLNGVCLCSVLMLWSYFRTIPCHSVSSSTRSTLYHHFVLSLFFTQSMVQSDVTWFATAVIFPTLHVGCFTVSLSNQPNLRTQVHKFFKLKLYNSAPYEALQQQNKHCALYLKTNCQTGSHSDMIQKNVIWLSKWSDGDIDPWFDLLAERRCSLIEDWDKDMINSVHRPWGWGPSPPHWLLQTAGYLLKYPVSKSQHTRHCADRRKDRQMFVELRGRY